MGMYVGENMDYTIETTELNYTGMRIYLEDTYISEIVYLNDNPNYTFYSETGTFEDRFILHFNPNRVPYLIGNIPDQETFTGELYEYSIPDGLFLDDDENDFLTFSVTLENGDNLPEWLTFNPDLRTFSGIADIVEILKINVTVTDNMGENISDIFELNVKSTTILEEKDNQNIIVFPVPAKNKIYINTGEINIKYRVEIKSLTGNIVYKNNFANEKINLLDLNSVQKGIYMMILIFEDNTTLVRKIILQ
jgi:hypothetical protein